MKKQKMNLIHKFVAIGLFGTMLAATTYVNTLTTQEIQKLTNSLDETHIHKAVAACGGTRSEGPPSGGKS